MFIRPLSSELQKKAEAELNEVAGRREEDLQHIREWLRKQPHLKIRTDDQWLVSFLRGCKYSLQRTKEKLDFFYTMRSLLPEFFTNRDPMQPELQEILKAGVLVPLPKTDDPASPRILLFRWGICDPDVIRFNTITKMYFMIMDALMNEDDNIMVAGVKLFFDLKGFSANFLLQCTPPVMKKTMTCVEKAYPVRTKKVDCCHAPSAFEMLFNIMKPFLTEKLKNRITLYNDEKSLKVYENYPRSLLPQEYGGDNGSVEELTDLWKKKIESKREWFIEDSKYRSFEELRLGTPKTTADIFGIEGTFRKLAVD